VRARDTLALWHQAQRLSNSQLGLMKLLHHPGPMRERAAPVRLLQSGGNVKRVVDNLEARSLVRRERHVDDLRFVTLHRTDEGRALTELISPGYARRITRLMSASPSAEQTTLAGPLRKLGRAAEAADGPVA